MALGRCVPDPLLRAGHVGGPAPRRPRDDERRAGIARDVAQQPRPGPARLRGDPGAGLRRPRRDVVQVPVALHQVQAQRDGRPAGHVGLDDAELPVRAERTRQDPDGCPGRGRTGTAAPAGRSAQTPTLRSAGLHMAEVGPCLRAAGLRGRYGCLPRAVPVLGQQRQAAAAVTARQRASARRSWAGVLSRFIRVLAGYA